MFVTVVGGGNSTPIFAALCKRAGHQVAILTRRPEAWSKTVGFKNEDTGYLDGLEHYEAEVDIVTKDPAECIPQSDMIFIAGLPIHHNPTVLKQLAPHVARDKKVMVGSICAYGGFNWVAADALGPGGELVFFGTQLIPWCCGTVEYGKTGVVFGAKRMLRIATEDNDSNGIKDIMRGILCIEDMRDSDFLASSLWPNNPSLHPPILYGLFKDWDGKEPLDAASLPVRIYAEMTDSSADALAKLDDELVAIVDALKVHYPENKNLHEDFRLKACILENYKDQVKDSSTLASTVRTNKAFGSHNVPYQQLEGGKAVPVLAHKFFETDLPFGLCLWKDVALMAGVPTPMLDTIVEWNQKLINKEYLKDGTISGKDAGECVLPSAYGLDIKSLMQSRRAQEPVQEGTPQPMETETA